MTSYTNMHQNENINRKNVKYNNVRGTKVSTKSDFASAIDVVAERVADAAYERRRRIARERANAPVIVKKHVKAKAFPVSFVFYALIVTVVMMFIVHSYSVINDISYDVCDLQERIASTKKENERLSLEIDKKNDLTYIEQVATTKLGMVKSTDVVKHYISISGGDTSVVSEDAEVRQSTSLGTTLDSLKDTVSKIYS